MSEPTWMRIEIGGDLPSKFLKEFLEVIGSEGFEEGPDSPEGLKEETEDGSTSASWAGSTNYGECDDLKAWLVNHGLYYVHYSGSNGEYNPALKSLLPGSNAKVVKTKASWGQDETKVQGEVFHQSNQDSEALIQVDQVRGLVDLLLGVLDDGLKAMPAFAVAEKDDIKEIAEKVLSLKRPTLKDLSKRIRKYADKILPVLPDVPPLRIVRTRRSK